MRLQQQQILKTTRKDVYYDCNRARHGVTDGGHHATCVGRRLTHVQHVEVDAQRDGAMGLVKSARDERSRHTAGLYWTPDRGDARTSNPPKPLPPQHHLLARAHARGDVRVGHRARVGEEIRGRSPAARFCLYYALANAVVSTAFWYFSDTPDVLAAQNRTFMMFGLTAYILDGIAWIFFSRSIITTAPSPSLARCPPPTPLTDHPRARHLVGNYATPQYAGVIAVLLGCIALAYAAGQRHATNQQKKTQKRWMGFAGAALAIWGVNGVIIKHAYSFEGGARRATWLYGGHRRRHAHPRHVRLPLRPQRRDEGCAMSLPPWR